MTFDPTKIETFFEFLEGQKHKIRTFEGCTKVEILQDKHDASKISTYSHWESEEHLDAYRHSDLFKYVWANTKIHFNQKATATTFICLDKL